MHSFRIGHVVHVILNTIFSWLKQIWSCTSDRGELSEKEAIKLAKKLNPFITEKTAKDIVMVYRNSGNFRVKKFSSIKFSFKNIFVPATPYRSNIHTAMKNFVHLIFVHNCAYENFLTTKISRTTVYNIIMFD